jgi:hypothetical protein
LPGQKYRLGLRNRCPQLHQNNNGHGRGHGRHRVHDDAQGAVVGVGLVGVKVGNLSYGEHRQQDKAYNCDGGRKTAHRALFATEMCRESRQESRPFTPILQKLRRFGRKLRGKGLRRGSFLGPTVTGAFRLNCVAMVLFRQVRGFGALSPAILLLAVVAAAGQSGQSGAGGQPAQNTPNDNSKPLPLKPAVPGMGRNHRLILKDGSYQLVRDYQIVGDRVRYLSQERGEWEELPVDLVDWDATKKWEKEHADLVQEDSSPAMKEAEAIDKEESDERNDMKARMPEVAAGLELPDEEGVFVLDTYQGTPELVELRPTDLTMNSKTHKGIGVLNPMATQREELELQGSHARVHLHVDDPAFYLSLGVEDEKEPVLSHPYTVDTTTAKPASNVKHGAHSPQSGFAIVRVDERQAVRIVGAIKVSANGTVTQDENTIPAKVEVVPGKHWLKIQPEQTLAMGEYALVEILSPSDINESVWDFRVDPRLGDNPGSIGPILKQPRDQ